ncbi:hypothetical protein Tco_0359219 [Tanacetum coccineum]
MVEKVEMEEFVWKHLLHVEEGGGKGLATLGECGGEALCDRGGEGGRRKEKAKNEYLQQLLFPKNQII